MLTSRCVYVGVGHILLSSMYLMASGKAAFSPNLFNIYIDDVSVNLNACRVGCCVGNEITNHLMYADDLVIMAPSVAALSKLLRICELFGASHDMIFNQKKSGSVYFISKTLKGAHLHNLYLNGEVILQVDSVKYLGHHLTNDLHDDLDIDPYPDNVGPLMFVATFFSGNFTCVVYR